MEAFMADLKTLREQMANAATEARSLLDQAGKSTDAARSAELETQHDKAMGEYDALSAKAERLSKLEAIEARAASDALAARESKRPGVDAREVTVGGDMTYRTAFHQYLRAQGQKGDMSSEARAALEQGFANVENRAQTTTAAAGGYTVPVELANVLVKSMLAWGPMYDPGITTEIVTAGGGVITMPTINDTAKVVVKHTEGTSLTDDAGSDAVFGEKRLEAYAFNTEWLRVSKELVDDSIFNMEALLGDLLGERLGRRANLELTTGDGTGDPNGIATASSLGKTAAATAAITWDEILDLEHSVDPAYRVGPKVRYMFNDATLLALRKLKDGDGNYLWQMGNVQGGVSPSFNGRSYSINQAMASLGAAEKVMLFGDFSKYYVRKVGSPLIGAIQDKDFWPGFGIAGYIRFDGELADVAAVKHLITAAS
jgi:HK97 family phage major capsid protein